jgi:cold shock CspA family protein
MRYVTVKFFNESKVTDSLQTKTETGKNIFVHASEVRAEELHLKVTEYLTKKKGRKKLKLLLK